MIEGTPEQRGPNARERDAGLRAFTASLNNVIVSHPEILDAFANALESEISTLDTDESKEALRNAIEAIRKVAATK